MTQADPQGLLTKFRILIDAARYDEIEGLWLECMDADPVPSALMLEVADILSATGKKQRAATLLMMLAEQLRGKANNSGTLAALLRVAMLNPAESGLREQLVAAYEAAYAGRGNISRMVFVSGLRVGKEVPEAVRLMELMLSYNVGELVRHETWGMGEVVEVRPRTLEVAVDFARRKGHAFGLELAEKLITRVPTDSFDGRKFKEPQALAKLAEDDPIALLKLVMRNRRTAQKGRDFKTELCPDIVPEAAWSRFWSNARGVLLKDPYVEAGTGTNAEYKLREQALSRSDEFIRLLAAARTSHQLVEALRQFIREFKGADLDADVAGLFQKALSDSFSENLHGAPWEAFEAAFALDDLADAWFGAQRIEAAALPKPGEAAQALDWLGKVARPDYQARFLDCARAGLPEGWILVYVKAVASPSAEVRNKAWEGLAGCGDSEKVRRECAWFLADPARDPEVYFRLVYAETLSEKKLGLGLNSVYCLKRMLELADRNRLDALVDKDKGARESWPRLRQVLQDQKFLAAALSGASLGDCRSLHELLLGLRYLDQTIFDVLERTIAANHPDAVRDHQEKKSDEIIVTAAGLARRRKEYENLINVELAQNARDLGEAIAKGDLSENAEYTAARDKQFRLTEQAKNMREELGRVKAIEPATVAGQKVEPGTRVTVRDAGTNEEHVYDILGPWDEAGPGAQIISYLSPIGAALLGAEAGQTVVAQVPGGRTTYEVLKVEISPVLAGN